MLEIKNMSFNRTTDKKETDKFDLLQKIMNEVIQNILCLIELQAHIVNGNLDHEGGLYYEDSGK